MKQEIIKHFKKYWNIKNIGSGDMSMVNWANDLIKDLNGIKKNEIDQICNCGHKHSKHLPIDSHYYSAGKCTFTDCKCKYFIIKTK